MSPGGHLVTTTVACAGTAVLTGSWAASGAVAAGGFFIDVAHVADYVLSERDRRLTPDAFLRHYLEGRTRRTVLVLHSYELLALLGLVAWGSGALWLWAYLWGATLHLALHLTFNGQVPPRPLVPFSTFPHRLPPPFHAPPL